MEKINIEELLSAADALEQSGDLHGSDEIFDYMRQSQAVDSNTRLAIVPVARKQDITDINQSVGQITTMLTQLNALAQKIYGNTQYQAAAQTFITKTQTAVQALTQASSVLGSAVGNPNWSQDGAAYLAKYNISYQQFAAHIQDYATNTVKKQNPTWSLPQVQAAIQQHLFNSKVPQSLISQVLPNIQ